MPAAKPPIHERHLASAITNGFLQNPLNGMRVTMGAGHSSSGGATPSSWGQNVVSTIRAAMPLAQSNLGEVWRADDAQKSFKAGALRSLKGGSEVPLAFRNATPQPLLLCWVDEKGKPHHFYRLPPQSSSVLSQRSSLLSPDDHVETSCVGHAFVIARCSAEEDWNEEDDEESGTANQKKRTLDPSKLVAAYRPRRKLHPDNKVYHLITVSQREIGSTCCPVPWKGFRGSHKKYEDTVQPTDDDDNDDHFTWCVTVQAAVVDGAPLDTSDKYYEKTTLGGWPVFVEPNWHGGNKALEERVAKDLECAARCLPEHAREFLRSNTPIYINHSQRYGPASCPTVGHGLCFHPGSDWLKECGMNPNKAECVEMFDAPGYLDDCCYWGYGGVLIHELSHAYHHKAVKDGYENKEILKCYQQAMKDKLYECVRVHGTQGPTAKAYACENQMEYFAELSAAFLGGIDPDEEFNKWYPFNRKQIKEHDPRAYELLQRVWKVNCDDVSNKV